ncbi:hypothetical protein NA56DRAFT_648038 [Hyaloscypha hepaticicola]|uniref:Secreted protein n=1 Tax=Hyaloscypha hepaticicola TaxID=2082293 RepID=A0A2J6PW62_9HELO|nr:hypothetical protein NA56DRAFT_648038 [Hyaloscypha hepaticicola]
MGRLNKSTLLSLWFLLSSGPPTLTNVLGFGAKARNPSGLGCSQQDFETMRVCAVLDLFFVELRVNAQYLLAAR